MVGRPGVYSLPSIRSFRLRMLLNVLRIISIEKAYVLTECVLHRLHIMFPFHDFKGGVFFFFSFLADAFVFFVFLNRPFLHRLFGHDYIVERTTAHQFRVIFSLPSDGIVLSSYQTHFCDGLSSLFIFKKEKKEENSEMI